MSGDAITNRDENTFACGWIARIGGALVLVVAHKRRLANADTVVALVTGCARIAIVARSVVDVCEDASRFWITDVIRTRVTVITLVNLTYTCCCGALTRKRTCVAVVAGVTLVGRVVTHANGWVTTIVRTDIIVITSLRQSFAIVAVTDVADCTGIVVIARILVVNRELTACCRNTRIFRAIISVRALLLLANANTKRALIVRGAQTIVTTRKHVWNRRMNAHTRPGITRVCRADIIVVAILLVS